MATIQLKELNQQHAQIFIGVSGIDARVKLRSEGGNAKFYHCFNIDSKTRAPVLLHQEPFTSCYCTCRKLMTMRMRLYELIPPVKTSFKSLCSRNCFSTKIR